METVNHRLLCCKPESGCLDPGRSDGRSNDVRCSGGRVPNKPPVLARFLHVVGKGGWLKRRPLAPPRVVGEGTNAHFLDQHLRLVSRVHKHVEEQRWQENLGNRGQRTTALDLLVASCHVWRLAVGLIDLSGRVMDEAGVTAQQQK
jgi:hypothetical protein